MTGYRSRRYRKSFAWKLFQSPHDRGLMDSPFVYLFLGVSVCVYAIFGLFSGEMDVGRYSQTIIRYEDGPVWYVFCALSLLALGVGALAWGRRLWRKHEE